MAEFPAPQKIAKDFAEKIAPKGTHHSRGKIAPKGSQQRPTEISSTTKNLRHEKARAKQIVQCCDDCWN